MRRLICTFVLKSPKDRFSRVKAHLICITWQINFCMFYFIYSLISLTEDLKAHRKSMKRMGHRVVELERMVKSSRLYLEDIAHKLDKTGIV